MDFLNILDIAITLAMILFSVIVHESMHGWAAEKLGDPTARMLGRITLNPIPHIDPLGSIVLPLILYFASNGGFVLGYAKPVPFNPRNLRDPVWGPAKVAAAGPLSNLGLAIVFGLIFRLILATGILSPDSPILFLVVHMVHLNVVLMMFNLVPIPPLDGSKILLPFLPYSWQIKYLQLERFGMILVLIFAYGGFRIIGQPIRALTRLLLGM